MRFFVVGAHLDDIELACGGTLAKAVQNGHDVKCLVMSKSGYTNKDGNIQRSNEEAVNEGVSALHVLGITDIEVLDYPTKDIRFESDVVTSIDQRMSAFSPDIVFCHHPFDTHQAHEGVAKATIAAARRQNTILFFEPIAPSGRSYVAFKPQIYVDISETIDKKILSLKEHKTEYNKFGGEDWIEGVTSRAGFRGYEMGVKYAESFELLRAEIKL